MERAYSILDTKSYREDEDKFYIEGMASTPTPDRQRDIVEPKGAKYKTPMPLLWQHDHSQPVGNVTFAKPEKNGIPFKAELPIIKEPGRLKDRIDEAIQSVKHKLVTAVSIGFRPIDDKYELMNNGGIRFMEWDWMELSLVTIPANSEAVLSAVKSLDKNHLAASGRKDFDRGSLNAGVTANLKKPVMLIPAKR